MYISEFSPSKIRGKLIALYQLSIVIGILLAYFSNWLLLNFSKESFSLFKETEILNKIFVSEVWRGMFGLEMIPSGLFILLLSLIPESPRWLIKNNKHEKGLNLLLKINGEIVANKEFTDIRNSIKQYKGKIRKSFQKFCT